MAKTLHYNFAANPSLSGGNPGPDLSITRATVAAMADADGWLREAATGAARFDGAAISTNLLANSNNFNGYVKTNSTPVQDATDAQGNANAAWTINGDGLQGGGGDEPVSIRTAAIQNTADKDVIWSFEAKAADKTWVRATIGGLDAYINLANGTFGTSDPFLDKGINNLGNGWYRVWLALNSTSNVVSYLYAADGDGDINLDNTSAFPACLTSRWMVEVVQGKWVENDILKSEVTSAADTAPEVNVTYPTVTPPPGLTGTVAVLTGGDASGYAYSWGGAPVNGTTPGDYIMSCYCKLTDGTQPTLASGSGANGNFAFNNYNTAFIPGTSGVEAVGGGWYRVWARYRITSVPGTGIGFIQYTAQGDFGGRTDVGVYITGLMRERAKPGQTRPSDYIHTTGAGVVTHAPSSYVETGATPVSVLSGTNNGLIVEEARTNICLQSETFGNASWVKFQSTATEDQQIAPDGSLTADLIKDDGLTGNGLVYVSQAITTATSTAYTLSGFFKADQLSWVALDISNMGALSITQYFDLANGVVGTPSANVDDSGIEDWGNGWYRCWMSFTSDAADPSADIIVFVADADGDVFVDRDTTSSIFAWGAQLEVGAFPSSYIRTTTTSVPRNRDEISTSDVSWFTASQGSWYGAGYAFVQVTGLANILACATGTTARHQLQKPGLSCRWRPVTATDSVILDVANTFTPGVLGRAAACYADDDYECYGNGTRSGTGDQTGLVPVAADNLKIGANSSFNDVWNGVVSEIAYYNERLSNEDLATLSLSGPSGLSSGGGATRASIRRNAAAAAVWYRKMEAQRKADLAKQEEFLKKLRR